MPKAKQKNASTPKKKKRATSSAKETQEVAVDRYERKPERAETRER